LVDPLSRQKPNPVPNATQSAISQFAKSRVHNSKLAHANAQMHPH